MRERIGGKNRVSNDLSQERLMVDRDAALEQRCKDWTQLERRSDIAAAERVDTK